MSISGMFEFLMDRLEFKLLIFCYAYGLIGLAYMAVHSKRRLLLEERISNAFRDFPDVLFAVAGIMAIVPYITGDMLYYVFSHLE